MKARHRNEGPTYRSWAMMKNRCLNPKAMDYSYYGGRGISVCKRWLDFENFKKDMGERPSIRYTIGRKNANRNYCPSNCLWETRADQSRARDYCKMTMQKAEKMRKLFHDGVSQKNLSKQFEVSLRTVANITSEKAWL